MNQAIKCRNLVYWPTIHAARTTIRAACIPAARVVARHWRPILSVATLAFWLPVMVLLVVQSFSLGEWNHHPAGAMAVAPFSVQMATLEAGR